MTNEQLNLLMSGLDKLTAETRTVDLKADFSRLNRTLDTKLTKADCARIVRLSLGVQVVLWCALLGLWLV